MRYRIEYADGRCCNFANGRADLLEWLKLLEEEEIADIRKVYKSGVFWTGRCIWMRAHPTSMSAMCLTVKTGMGSCVPSRKRRWRNWGLNCLIRVSPRANTIIENRLLMQYAGQCFLTSATSMGCIWSRNHPMVGGRIWKSRIIS